MKRLIVSFVGILVIGASVLIVSFVASAEENAGISWIRSIPTVGGSLPTTYNDIYNSMYCPVDYSQISVSGQTGMVSACMVKSDDVSFATYSRYGVAVSFRNDTKMYPLEIDCYSDLCTYLPQTDTLAIRQHKDNSVTYGLAVYKNFSDRLVRRVNPTTLAVTYAFNYDNPSYEFKDSSGYYWAVERMAGSDNGRFLAVELRNMGVGLLDIDTLTMRYISGRAFMYWHGSDPTIEFAVSNDGRFVAEMGRNAGMTIYEVNDACGDLLDVHRMDTSLLPPLHACAVSPIDYSFIDNFHEAYNPVFSSNGDSLSFYATSYTIDPRKIELHASGYVGSQLDYLALGDSFTSGEGAELDSEYLDGTNTGYDKCHISINSYPFILARMQQFDMNYVKSVACSGAVMEDVVGDDDIYWGQSSRIKNYTPTPNQTKKSNFQLSAIDIFTPGLIHQNTFVQHYHPSIISIGIGGNDIGFADKLRACLGPDTCSWAGTVEGKEMTAIEIKSIYSKLVQTYNAIHAESPNAKIYVIGYPKLINESSDCGGLIGYLLNADERKFINEGVSYLNQVIQSAASTAGVKYVDIEDSLGLSALCGDGQPSGMNSIRLGDDSAVIDTLQWLKLIGQESFHPNTLGHAKIATKIKATISNLESYDYCNNGLIVCPVDTPPPEPSEYWVPGIYHNYPLQKMTNFVTDDVLNENHKTLILPDHSLSPSAEVQVTVASEPQTIGTYTADSKGGLTQEINLPPNLDPGYHTLHIYDISYSGEAVDLYQVIAYNFPAPDPVNQDTPSQNQLDSEDTDTIDGDTQAVSVINKDNDTTTDEDSGNTTSLNQQAVQSGDKAIDVNNPVNKPSDNTDAISGVLGAKDAISSDNNLGIVLLYTIAGVVVGVVLTIIYVRIKAN